MQIKSLFALCVLVLMATPIISLSGPQETPRDSVSTRTIGGVNMINYTTAVTFWGANRDNAESETFGSAVGMGDLNGDGYDDIVIDAMLQSVSGQAKSGRIFGYYGRPGMALSSPYDATTAYNFSIYDGTYDSKFCNVMICPDLDKDGCDELITAHEQAGGDTGQGRIYWGQTTKRTGDAVKTTSDVAISGISGNDEGFLALASGDIDKDGNVDLIASARNSKGPGDVKEGTGEAYVFFGRGTKAAWQSISSCSNANITIYGADGKGLGMGGDYFGASVACGDINGDGYDDVLVGAPGGDGVGNSIAEAGEAVVIFGGPRASLPTSVDVNKSRSTDNPDIYIYGFNSGDSVGLTMACDDLDGDGKDDIIVGSSGSGYKGIYVGAGDTYVIWGNTTANFNDTYNLKFSEYDLVIYGDSNYRANSFSIGDFNGDGRKDLVIGAPGSKSSSGIAGAGEVEVVFGKPRSQFPPMIMLNRSWDWPHQDMCFVGPSMFGAGITADEVGSSVACGDVNKDGLSDIIIGAQYGDGPSDARLDDGEAYLVYGLGFKTTDLELLYADSGVCYPEYTTYDFKVNSTNVAGANMISKVRLVLDPGNVSKVLEWTASGDKFSEKNDPTDQVHLTSTSMDSTVAGKNLTLDFRLLFNWSYPSSDLSTCMIETYDSSNNMLSAMYYDVFRVEKRMELLGDLNVTGAKQGYLSDGSYVAANEAIRWTGLRAVYYSTSIPVATKYYSVSVKDRENTTWTNSSLTGSSFNITTVSKSTTDSNYTHTINITGVQPGASAPYGRDMLLKVDADAPLAPPNMKCHADSPYDPNFYDNDTAIFVTWDPASDPGSSGVERYYVAFNDPNPLTPAVSGVQLTAFEGKNLPAYVRAVDHVGNIGPLSQANISIDITKVAYKDLWPSSGRWFNSPNVDCGVTFMDSSSGVDGMSMQYRSTSTGTMPATWVDLPKQFAAPSLVVDTTVSFTGDGIQNYVQFRAKDAVDSGYLETPSINIKIDTIQPTYSGAFPQTTEWLGQAAVTVGVTFSDSGSGINASTIQYAYSTDGLDKFSAWIPGGLTTNAASVGFSKAINFVDGTGNYFKFRAKDVADTDWVETVAYPLKLDLTNVKFTATGPKNATWFDTQNISFTCTIQDPSGSGVSSQVQYAISTNGHDFGVWTNVSGLASGKKTLSVQASHIFPEGKLNAVKWRARGVSSSGWVVSNATFIYVDVTAPISSFMTPAPDTWFYSTSVPSSIKFIDTYVGVDPSTIEVCQSISGPGNYSNWYAPSSIETQGAGVYMASQTLLLAYGQQNYVKWRAMDLLGNGYTETADVRIFINSIPKAIITAPQMNWTFRENQTISFSANDSFDDDHDALTYRWASNISGDLGNLTFFAVKLKAGQHRITLSVYDVHGNTTAAYVDITILAKNQTTGVSDSWKKNGGNVTDSDGDTLPDWWEAESGLNPKNASDATPNMTQKYQKEKANYDIWEQDHPVVDDDDVTDDDTSSSSSWAQAFIICFILLVIGIIVGTGIYIYMKRQREKEEALDWDGEDDEEREQVWIEVNTARPRRAKSRRGKSGKQQKPRKLDSKKERVDWK